MLTFHATEQIYQVSRTRTTRPGLVLGLRPDPGGLGVQGRICIHMTLRPKQATLIL